MVTAAVTVTLQVTVTVNGENGGMKRVQWLRSAAGRGEEGAVLQQGLRSAAARTRVTF